MTFFATSISKKLGLQFTATPIRRIEGDKSVSENDDIFAIQYFQFPISKKLKIGN